MRLSLLTALVLVAFAANSILNRMAVGPGHIDAITFANIRALAGAVMLGALVLARGRALPLLQPDRLVGAGSLSLYLLGFSLAYVQIDAGIGALILFGAVQVTMFAGSLLDGERPPPRRWIGAGLALVGLGWLGWPSGAAALPPGPMIAMATAGVAWGVYSLAGRTAQDPMATTGANFICAVPVVTVAMILLLPTQTEPVPLSLWGTVLAIAAGAVTSGLGYALWYTVLPKLGGSVSALLQLLVPVLATVGGIVLLGEAVTWRMVGAGALTLGGIAYGLGVFQRKTGSSGS